MLHRLINPNPDLKRLWEEGYNLEIREPFIIVKKIPYVNSHKDIKYGTLITSLHPLAGDRTQIPQDHTIYFVGECPCRDDGSSLQDQLVCGNGPIQIGKGLTANYQFSRKPKPNENYSDYYAKITAYVGFISCYAQLLDKSVTASPCRVDVPNNEDYPFHYIDSAPGEGGYNIVADKLALGAVAIVGLGGTGSYVLDLVAKTPVKKIHLFDGDVYSTHNAFRSPGAPSKSELEGQPQKVDYFKGVYEKMHRGIVPHDMYLDASNVDMLQGMDFVFLCIDKNEPKKFIVAKLEELKIPFIDVGMGLYLGNETLVGVLRVTTSTPQQRNHVRQHGRILFEDGEKNDYDKNIQVGDLNALNAALAVVKWKKLLGFYSDFNNEFHSEYIINCNRLTSKDCLEAP